MSRMRACPICHATATCASHRQSWIERGPLTWCGVFPFHCSRCQTRFYRLALRDPRRRRHIDVAESIDHARESRHELRVTANVTIHPTGGRPVAVSGETENVSSWGVAVRLPIAIPVGDRVRLVLQGSRPRWGRIRWVEAREKSWCSHGVEFEAPLERYGPAPMAIQRQHRRRTVRRLLIWVIGLGIIAATTAVLVWMMDAFRNYRPQYYEPRDIERERHESQLLRKELKGRPQAR